MRHETCWVHKFAQIRTNRTRTSGGRWHLLKPKNCVLLVQGLTRSERKHLETGVVGKVQGYKRVCTEDSTYYGNSILLLYGHKVRPLGFSCNQVTKQLLRLFLSKAIKFLHPPRREFDFLFGTLRFQISVWPIEHCRIHWRPPCRLFHRTLQDTAEPLVNCVRAHLSNFLGLTIHHALFLLLLVIGHFQCNTTDIWRYQQWLYDL